MSRQSALTCPTLSSLLCLFFDILLAGRGELCRHGAAQVVDGWQKSFSVEQEVQRGKLHLKQHQVNSCETLNTWCDGQLTEENTNIISSTWRSFLFQLYELQFLKQDWMWTCEFNILQFNFPVHFNVSDSGCKTNINLLHPPSASVRCCWTEFESWDHLGQPAGHQTQKHVQISNKPPWHSPNFPCLTVNRPCHIDWTSCQTSLSLI